MRERDRRLRAVFARRAEEQDAAECARQARTGRRRTRVVPVAFDTYPPLGLALILADAKAYEGGILEDPVPTPLGNPAEIVLGIPVAVV